MNCTKNFEYASCVVKKCSRVGGHVSCGRYNQLNRKRRRLELREEPHERPGREFIGDLVRQKPPDPATCLHRQNRGLDVIEDKAWYNAHDLVAAIASEPPLHWM